MEKLISTTVDEYIATFPPEVGELLEQIRAIIKKVAPTAIEKISWEMPGYSLGGKSLVFFAAYKKHVGLYPFPSGLEAFEKELAGYKQSKGTVQFPINQPLPRDLIAKIVKFRVEENLNITSKKGK